LQTAIDTLARVKLAHHSQEGQRSQAIFSSKDRLAHRRCHPFTQKPIDFNLEDKVDLKGTGMLSLIQLSHQLPTMDMDPQGKLPCFGMDTIPPSNRSILVWQLLKMYP
jgi:hypothetical protein